MRPIPLVRPLLQERVSIHAPGRGATGDSLAPRDLLHVSIHAPGRGATRLEDMDDAIQLVSIHAPGRGATSSHDRCTCHQRCFNSRTREGCDAWLARNMTQVRCRFNSRTREGCDLNVGLVKDAYIQVSIHAPGRGATANLFSSVPTVIPFQFTHPGGVRLISMHFPDLFYISFNSRTREGCDLPKASH